jgi:hypothetical protein
VGLLLNKKINFHNIIIAVACVVFVCIVAIGIYLQDRECINTIKFVVNTDSTSEKISLFHNDGKYYAFLPSYADLEDMNIEYISGCSVYIDDELYNSESALQNIKTDDEYKLVVKNSLGITVSEETLIVMKSTDIPALSIQLNSGTIDDINNDKTVEKSGACTLIKEDGAVDYEGSFSSMHGRGNSSWEQVKKPYALEFSDNTNLLKMGENTNYVLVANAMDESNIRDKIVYDAAIRAGLDYSVESNFVDLYIDDEYYGLYLLTNKVEVSESRINITDLYEKTQSINQYKLSTYDTFSETIDGIFQKGFLIPNNPTDITGGYLIELELKERVKNEDNLFTTQSGQNVTVKSPKSVSEQQMNYISSYVQDMENAFSSDKATEYIDMDSWVDYYLVQEVFANTSLTSYFFYKDSDSIDSKFYAGPIWDFDLSMGTVNKKSNSNPQKFYVNNWGWFEKLFENETFVNAVKNEYKTKFKALVSNIISEKIDEYADTIDKSYLMNEARWNNIQSNWWVNHYDTQQEHVEYLKNYLTERLEFLDDVWINNKEVDISEENTDVTTTVEEGNVFSKLLQKIQDRLTGDNRDFYLLLICFAVICLIVAIVVIKDMRSVLKKSRRYKNGK